jgi:hypothetical protein
VLYQLSYGRLSSGQGQNRTADTMIFSHVLYQLSYLALQPRLSGTKNPRCGSGAGGHSNLPDSPAGPADRQSSGGGI